MDITSSARLTQLLIHIEGAYAPNTIRAYKADMGEFILYCAENSTCALPAPPVDIAKFLLTTCQMGLSQQRYAEK